MKVRSIIILSIILWLFEGNVTAQESFLAGRLIVKFKDSLTVFAPALMQSKESFNRQAIQSGLKVMNSSLKASSLDQLNLKYGVSSIHSLWMPVSMEQFIIKSGQVGAKQIRRVYENHLKEIDAQFPLRSARATEGAMTADLYQLVVLEFDKTKDVMQAAHEYSQNPNVEYAHPDYFVQEHEFILNTDQYKPIWNMRKIKAEEAWRKNVEGKGVMVAVIDGGLDISHPNISKNIWNNPKETSGNNKDDDHNGFIDDVHGWNFFTNSSAINDDDSIAHGSHVAGIIAAGKIPKGEAIGVAPQATIMPIISGGSTHQSAVSSKLKALLYALDNGADVINCSWGIGYYESVPAIEETIKMLYAKGVVMVFSAGNDPNYSIDLDMPQHMKEVITVAASDRLDRRASFSSKGWTVDVTAPGVGILSLKTGNKYQYHDGTSMSAPHVAGLAALLLSKDQTLSVEQIRQIIRVSSDDIETKGFDALSGAGRINALSAVYLPSVLTLDIASPINASGIDSSKTELKILGTVMGPGFKDYQLEYSLQNPIQWIPITATINKPVRNGVLGVWSTKDIPVGHYVLRLKARTLDGKTFERYVSLYRDFVSEEIVQDPAYQLSKLYVQGHNLLYTKTDFSDHSFLMRYDFKTGLETVLDNNFYQGFIGGDGDDLFWRNNSSDLIHLDLNTGAKEVITNTFSDIKMYSNYLIWEETTGRFPYTLEVWSYNISLHQKVKLATIVNRPNSSAKGFIFNYQHKFVGKYLDNQAITHSVIYDVDAQSFEEISGDYYPFTIKNSTLYLAGKTKIIQYDLNCPQVSSCKINEVDFGVVGRDYQLMDKGYLLQVYRENYDQNLYFYDIKAKQKYTVVEHVGRLDMPVKVDSNRLIFSATRDGYKDLLLYDFAEHQLHLITANVAQNGDPILSNMDLYFTKLDSQGMSLKRAYLDSSNKLDKIEP